MIPQVVIHNWMSADGRLDHVNVDMGLFYGLAAATWKEDATLVGCDTIRRALAMASESSSNNEASEQPPAEDTSAQIVAADPDTRPLLVVVDSRGRIQEWATLKAWPYWRSQISLCANHTPAAHTEFLRRLEIPTIITGKERVDLRSALEELSAIHGVKTVRVDSGGALNGALLRAGLVSEISLLIEPSVTGGDTFNGPFRITDLGDGAAATALRLRECQKLERDIVWLRYEVLLSGTSRLNA